MDPIIILCIIQLIILSIKLSDKFERIKRDIAHNTRREINAMRRNNNNLNEEL